MDTHLTHVRRCYALADEAVARGNHPFGALLALDGVVVGEAMNEVATSGDPTRHAESVLLASVLSLMAEADRSRAVLYSSTEPCAMCTGALYWSGVGTVIYGCSSQALAAAAGGEFVVPCRELLARGRRAVTVVGPVLEDEGRAKHQAYWPNRPR
jgi:tRNA(Arg) A34 adenosine deaminase TadA